MDFCCSEPLAVCPDRDNACGLFLAYNSAFNVVDFVSVSRSPFAVGLIVGVCGQLCSAVVFVVGLAVGAVVSSVLAFLVSHSNCCGQLRGLSSRLLARLGLVRSRRFVGAVAHWHHGPS